MISIKAFKIVAKDGNLSLFSGATAVQSRPKSHTFTVNLAVFAPPVKMAVKNRGRVYWGTLCDVFQDNSDVEVGEKSKGTLLPLIQVGVHPIRVNSDRPGE